MGYNSWWNNYAVVNNTCNPIYNRKGELFIFTLTSQRLRDLQWFLHGKDLCCLLVPSVMRKAAQEFFSAAQKSVLDILGAGPHYQAAKPSICFQCVLQSLISRGTSLPTGPDSFNVTHQILSQTYAKYLQEKDKCLSQSVVICKAAYLSQTHQING